MAARNGLEPDYYAVLSVDPCDSAGQITSAYRRLVRALHPDTSTSPADHDRFTQVVTAYEVLGDPQRRAAYDTTRRARDPHDRPPGRRVPVTVANDAPPPERHPAGMSVSYLMPSYLMPMWAPMPVDLLLVDLPRRFTLIPDIPLAWPL
jgi:curved DNA-binding protein CbpA